MSDEFAIDYNFLEQLRALAAKIAAENEQLKREITVTEVEANDGR